MSQYYPGSNIDAWFQANGISQEMREYWWTYALGKANRSVASDASGNLFQVANPAAIGPPDTKTQKNNLAALRLNSTNVMTQGEFSLGSKLSGAYGNKEQSNRMFGEMMSKFLSSALPGALSDGVLGFMQYMPDIIEDLLMGLLERAPGNLQTAVGVGGLLDAFIGGQGDGGDAGDIGDMPGAYGAMGGTTTSGMHPDMRRKLGAMQRANPRIKITSGLRDTGLQQRLKRKGVGKVSGKPSAHTRGMAADLGPRSEYGWIAQNASKFGLKSGLSQGEPWHVGIGDEGVGDFKEDLMNIFKGLTGGGSSLGAEGMFGIMNSIMGLLGKGLNSDGSAGPSFQPDLYDKLLLKDNAGLPIKRTTTVPAASGGVPSGGGGGTASSPTGSGIVGVGKNILTGQQVAQLVYNQGFRGENLVDAVAIAKRESGWVQRQRLQRQRQDRGQVVRAVADQHDRHPRTIPSGRSEYHIQRGVVRPGDQRSGDEDALRLQFDALLPLGSVQAHACDIQHERGRGQDVRAAGGSRRHGVFDHLLTHTPPECRVRQHLQPSGWCGRRDKRWYRHPPHGDTDGRPPGERDEDTTVEG